MYQWVVFAHVLGVFGFLLAHGTSAAIAFKLRGEREVARVGALLDLSRGANQIANICLLILLVAGIAGGFMGNWWAQGWIWAALGMLIALSVVMTLVGSGPLIQVRRLLEANARAGEPLAAEAEKQVGALLGATHPMLLAALGGGGLAIILWLMMFKPF